MNIQKNQIFTVKITDMGTDGEGIGHLEDSGALSGNGYTLFVKDAVLGDTVRAKVVKPKKGYAFARLEDFSPLVASAEAKSSAVLFFKKVRLALRVLISLEKFKKDFMKDGGFFKGIQVQ